MTLKIKERKLWALWDGTRQKLYWGDGLFESKAVAKRTADEGQWDVVPIPVTLSYTPPAKERSAP